MASARRRLVALLALGLIPWTVTYVGGEANYVFSVGLVTFDPLHVTHVYDYLFVHTDGLPPRLQAWPAGLLLYAAALASGTAALFEREDARLTGGLLVFAGVGHAHVSYGLYRAYETSVSATAPSATVLPVGAVATWIVVWWYYWPLVRGRNREPAE